MQVKFNIVLPPSPKGFGPYDRESDIRKIIEQGLPNDVIFSEPEKNLLLYGAIQRYNVGRCSVALRLSKKDGIDHPIMDLVFTIPDNRSPSLLADLMKVYRSIHEYVKHQGGVVEDAGYRFDMTKYKAIKDWYRYEGKLSSYHQFPWWCNWLDILGTSTGPAQVFGSSHGCTRESLLASLILYGNYEVSFHQDFEYLGGAAVGKIKFTGLPDDLNAHITKWAHEKRSSQIQNFIAVTNSAKAMMLDSLHAFINKREM